MTPRWRWLDGFVNAASARRVEEATSIARAEFERDFILQNRPLVLRGAASAWRAMARWNDAGYLKANVEDRELNVYRDIGYALGNPRRKTHPIVSEPMTFHTFVDCCFGPDDGGYYQLLAERPRLMRALYEDLDPYQLLDKPKKPLVYPQHRMFLYRRSYTDWHFHVTDEHLTTQVVGKKRFLLLDPGQETWDRISPILIAEQHLEPDHTWPEPAREVQPWIVDLAPGDTLYIPAFWWHAAEALDDSFGATTTATFRTPTIIAGDTRYPATRLALKTLAKDLRSLAQVKKLALLVGMVGASAAQRLLHRR